ncbi:MAG: hypothetical protein ACI9D4_002545 [Polaribacter sp.]
MAIIGFPRGFCIFTKYAQFLIWLHLEKKIKHKN